MGYVRRNREKFFPWVTDFSDPLDELRNKPPSELNQLEWFWFSPFAYNYITYAIPGWMAFCSLAATIYFIMKSNLTVAFLIALVYLYFMQMLIKKYKERGSRKGLNFYDIFVRDEVKK